MHQFVTHKMKKQQWFVLFTPYFDIFFIIYISTAIEALTEEKTIIMIAHRLKTVRHADNILVIDDGMIVQSGTHDELMHQGGIYRRFVESRETSIFS